MKKLIFISLVCLLFYSCSKFNVPIGAGANPPTFSYANDTLEISISGHLDYNLDQMFALMKAGATVNWNGIMLHAYQDTLGHAAGDAKWRIPLKK